MADIERETMAGLYPDPDDPMFAARLYQKREFYEARSVAARVADGTLDPCTAAAEAVFELTPVQRIVSRFLHPTTPYMGLLLFHGVGVGKTCSAVTIAEQFLESSSTKVIVLVPQALQDNFKRTVFDPSKLVWNNGWSSRQCTGTSYLERLGLMENPDLRIVTNKIEDSKRARYTVTGYQAFANWIAKTLAKRVPAGLTDPVARQVAENEVLRRLFSDHLIIVDEAHNLRDLSAGEPESSDENQGGKALNPFLRRIVLHAEGLRLVLMSATPMYNSAPEIVLLLNYLLMNDSKSEASAMRIADLFTKDGDLVGDGQALERAARRYVSYMRGENPYTFPLRMHPLVAAKNPASMWPTVSATKRPVNLTGSDAAAINALPIVFTEPVTGSPVEKLLRGSTRGGLVTEEEIVDSMLDTRMQMANLTYPNEMYGISGFDFHFEKHTGSSGGHKLRLFKPKEMDVDDVFAVGLRVYAPKIHRILESVRKARGISFIYSRYIKSGALPMAIALERAGFQRRLADGKIAPLLTVAAPPPICAICGSQNTPDHGHPFQPACYILLTSDDDISPNFAGLVRQATTWTDPEYGPLGSNVKVIIGSQVASEGLDLKCVREMHILDSWYHLNRTDQIIGRAIRYCSHTALRPIEEKQGLPLMSLNNCLIYMHCVIVPETVNGPALETADMYAYRVAIVKAQMVGKVQRLLKKNAWDCNLELAAITFVGLPPRIQLDAQGNERRSLADDGTELDGYSINDQDYTTYCDYQVCAHECAVTVTNPQIEESTFGFSDARKIVVAKQDRVRRLFADRIVVPAKQVEDIFNDLPWEIASEARMELLDSRRFTITRSGVTGYLVPKAEYLVFQPLAISDTDIPMAMRYARAFQLRRHFIERPLPVWGRAEEAGPVVVKEEDVFGPWTSWASYVEGSSDLPSNMPRLWNWILSRYESVPELRTIALQWWIEKNASYKQQRLLIENALKDPSEVLIHRTLKKNIQRTQSSVTYRIVVPDENRVEFFCRKKEADTPFAPCPSTVAALIDKTLGNTPVKIPEETGSLLGFIMPKEGKLIFKTLETSTVKPKGPGKKPAVEAQRSVGAECGGSSNLRDHQKRVRLLQAAGRASELAAFMLPDSDETWVSAGARERNNAPEHLKDLTHAPLCLYMEFLTRLFDARRIGGKRWFLSAVEAAQTNMMIKR